MRVDCVRVSISHDIARYQSTRMAKEFEVSR